MKNNVSISMKFYQIMPEPFWHIEPGMLYYFDPTTNVRKSTNCESWNEARNLISRASGKNIGAFWCWGINGRPTVIECNFAGSLSEWHSEKNKARVAYAAKVLLQACKAQKVKAAPAPAITSAAAPVAVAAAPAAVPAAESSPVPTKRRRPIK